MITNRNIECPDFPCQDVEHAAFTVPQVNIDPSKVTVVLITETASRDPVDYFYAGPQGLFARTTRLVFGMAGLPFDSMGELLERGIYLTTAVKCAKIGNGVGTETVMQCSYLLERELEQFSNVKAYLLMGDVAIKAFNAIAKRQGQPRPIPAGATYKIRKGEFYYRGARVFPSYLQAGLNIFLETGKQGVIAEDIRRALEAAAVLV
jgi:uracil-DNA glycosylase